MGYRFLDKIRILALRNEFAKADLEIKKLLPSHSQHIIEELALFSADCNKIGYDEAMLWAAKWLVELDKTDALAYVRIINYYDRKGQWAELNAVMDKAEAEVPKDHKQRLVLNRNISRIRRKMGDLHTTAN